MIQSAAEPRAWQHTVEGDQAFTFACIYLSALNPLQMPFLLLARGTQLMSTHLYL